MNANAAAQAAPNPASRFDEKFIEDHQLIERYLEQKLPVKGAARNSRLVPRQSDYLNRLKVVRARSSQPEIAGSQWSAARYARTAAPWWKASYVPIALAAITILSLLGFWALFGKIRLASRRTRGHPHPHATRIAGAAGHAIEPAGLSGSRTGHRQGAHLREPEHAAAHRPAHRRQLLEVDPISSGRRQEGSRAGADRQQRSERLERRIAGDVQHTGLAAGIYDVRLEALPFRGSPIADGWLVLDVR